ncbi:amino acid adenylation domain-containing protein, partial [Dactylosporangium darangshiense]
FFDLGGHSLLATQAITRTRTHLNIDLPLATLFDHPTIHDLAHTIDTTTNPASPPITPADRTQPLPLSFAQQRLWFLHQLEPDSIEFNNPTVMHFRGDVDAAALASALTAIVERHETLRTRLVSGPDGVPYQVVDPPAPFPLRLADVSAEVDPRPALDRLLAENVEVPFDLAAEAPLRGSLVRVSADLHVLALCVHHIAYDEWSAEIFHDELTTLYSTYRAGAPNPLPPLPIQYADYAAWQRHWLAGKVLDTQLDYWRTQLADPPVLDLPTDRPRPAVRSTTGAVVGFTVPNEVAAGLRELSRRHGVTMFMTLAAAYAVVLGRNTGQTDLLIGTPIANRGQAETEALIGFFVNTLVLRTRLNDDPTFTELLAQVRTTALDAYAHQDVPFEQLVDALVQDRDRSRTPLVQTLLNYLVADQTSERTSLPDREDVVAKFDLRLMLVESTAGLAGGFEYATALFDRLRIERLIEHLLQVLDAAVANPDQPVSRLAVLSAAEPELLAGWNATDAVLPALNGVHALFEAQATRSPDTAAVVTDDGLVVTYAQLNTQADQLAGQLTGLGVGAETVVGLCLDHGVDTITAILAVWKAGGAYLPLDPTHPIERLAYMLADSGTAVLVTTNALLDDLPAGRLPTVILDNPTTTTIPNGQPRVHPSQAAYIIYTSGSTGRPKGVIATHHSLINYTLAIPNRTGTGRPGGRYALLQPATTDFGNTIILAALSTGGSLHLPDPDRTTDPGYLATFLHTHHIDYLKIVPSHLAALTTDHPLPELLPGDTLILGGERTPTTLAADLENLPVQLINHYGPTETTIGVSTHTGSHTGATIGRPIANTRAHILDRHLNPVPIGTTGELHIAGAGITRGYLHQPARTAERFIPNPFAGDGSRLYRTGDLAYHRPDGQLEYLGRTDHQIKIRGHRIEPAEIQTALTTHPAITTAIVTEHDQQLTAYLIAADGMPPADELRAHLHRTLPEHMIPTHYIELTQLPLTANGKLDRTALPAPDTARPELTTTYQPPTTPTEELLAHIWAELLHLDEIGVSDNFFDLGGHSLLATQVITRIRTTFNVDLPLAVLFDEPTIGAAARHIDAAARSGATATSAPITVADRGAELPLSFAQQRLWFVAQLDPESTEYNNPTAISFNGSIDVTALTDALSAIVERHEVLRTRLVVDADGVPHQVIDPPGPFRLSTVDVSDQADPQRACRDLVGRDAAVPFDLAAGPLIRATLVRLADEHHVLALCLHHVVSDEWSAKIFDRELSELYHSYRAGLASPLAPLPVQYADYAVWQRNWLTGAVLDAQLDFWRTQLADPPVLELPTDRPHPPVRDTAGAALDFAVPAELAAALRALSRRNGVTTFMTLVAAYTALLHRYTGQDDLLIGTPIANRTQAGTEPLIGFFVNTLVLRARLDGDPTFAEVLARTRATALDAYGHQDLPFERLVDELVRDRDRSRTPLIQTLFNYFTPDETPAQLQAPSADAPPREGVVAPFDLRLIFAETRDGLIGAIEYPTALFDHATIQRMAAHLLLLLESIAADPDRPISQLDVLTPAERTQLEAWNATDAAVPAQPVHTLIAAHAHTNPDRPAVHSGEHTHT